MATADRDPPWVVFYGSLMRGLGTTERLGVDARIRFVGPCTVAGELYDLGDWPGLRPGNGRVVGEIHALLDDAVLGVLDGFEDYDAMHPRESMYLRERVPLLDTGGGDTAWTYVYNQVPDASTRIPHGDWRRWLAERGG